MAEWYTRREDKLTAGTCMERGQRCAVRPCTEREDNCSGGKCAAKPCTRQEGKLTAGPCTEQTSAWRCCTQNKMASWAMNGMTADVHCGAVYGTGGQARGGAVHGA